VQDIDGIPERKEKNTEKKGRERGSERENAIRETGMSVKKWKD
jgi:hypothetical protein